MSSYKETKLLFVYFYILKMTDDVVIHLTEIW